MLKHIETKHVNPGVMRPQPGGYEKMCSFTQRPETALQDDPGHKKETTSIANFSRQIAQVISEEFLVNCFHRDGKYLWKPYASEQGERPGLATRIGNRIEQLEKIFSAAGELASSIDPLIVASAPFAEECFGWIASGKYSRQCLRRMFGVALDRFQWNAARGLEEWRPANRANADLVKAVLDAMEQEAQVAA